MTDLWQDPSFAAEVAKRTQRQTRELWKRPGYREAVVARVAARMTVHGLNGHPLGPSYRSMMTRCYRPRARSYPDYGGRGIRVFGPWHDVRDALAWLDAHLGPRADGMSIDRIDNNGHYEPGNLKWSTSREQRLNTGRREVKPIRSPKCVVPACVCGGI